MDVDNNVAFVVTEVFKGDHDKFKANKRFDTWCKMWDDSYEGYVEFETIFQLSKRVGIMGPLAAALGRLADHHICTEGVKYNFALKQTIMDSLDSKREKHTLNRNVMNKHKSTEWTNEWTDAGYSYTYQHYSGSWPSSSSCQRTHS